MKEYLNNKIVPNYHKSKFISLVKEVINEVYL